MLNKQSHPTCPKYPVSEQAAKCGLTLTHEETASNVRDEGKTVRRKNIPLIILRDTTHSL
jgi:hypothetical protein